MIRLTLPLRLVSESNARGHWSKRAKRAVEQRGVARLALMPSVVGRAVRVPCTVTIVRIAPRALDDDNLRSAGKATRDGIADALGVDDGSPLVTWCYAQEKGPYAVRIEVEMRAPLPPKARALVATAPYGSPEHAADVAAVQLEAMGERR